MASPEISLRPPVEAPRRSLPPALAANVWKPGQSGNPNGKGGEYQRCLSLCREKSYANAVALQALADSTKDERLEFMARTWLYETAWGKPKEYDPSKEKDPNKPKFDPRLLTPQQLDIVEYALKLMVQATRAPGGVEIIDQPAADEGDAEVIDQAEDYAEVEPGAVDG
jgi:hypothetical protein